MIGARRWIVFLTHAALSTIFAVGAMAALLDDPPKPDPFRDRGVPPSVRRDALAERARERKRDELTELLEAIVACGACPASRDLENMLASWDPAALSKPEVMERLLAMAAPDRPDPVRVAAARAINAVPEASRPAAAGAFAATKVEIVCVPGQMRWDPKEFSVPAGTVVELRMRNDDSMQHNLLVVAPGSLSEIGVAADRLGETAEAKAREYVPESPKVLHVMGLTDPGKTGTLWLIAPSKAATYPLVCTYPGHWRMMNGKMKVTKPGA